MDVGIGHAARVDETRSPPLISLISSQVPLRRMKLGAWGIPDGVIVPMQFMS
jgi:hypothetical protein